MCINSQLTLYNPRVVVSGILISLHLIEKRHKNRVDTVSSRFTTELHIYIYMVASPGLT